MFYSISLIIFIENISIDQWLQTIKKVLKWFWSNLSHIIIFKKYLLSSEINVSACGRLLVEKDPNSPQFPCNVSLLSRGTLLFPIHWDSLSCDLLRPTECGRNDNVCVLELGFKHHCFPLYSLKISSPPW